MSFEDRQRKKAKTRALVLVGSDAASNSASDSGPHSAGRAHSFNPQVLEENSVNMRVLTARSTFATQLFAQYETRAEAVKRRAEARADMIQRYQRPKEKDPLRHLVWA